MENKTKGKIMQFFRNYGTIMISGFLIVAIAITLLCVGLAPKNDTTDTGGGSDVIIDDKNHQTPVDADPITYYLPMKNASVVKDFSNEFLQFNQTLGRWEAHLSVDLMGLDNEVMAVRNGTVIAVENDFLMGNIIKIDHGDGLVSVYSSLDNTNVSVGDTVVGGQVIATAGDSAASEAGDGVHLDFAMLLNEEEVDPNNYIALQNK